jgi:hypothetical protein
MQRVEHLGREALDHDVGRCDQVEDRGIVGRTRHRTHAVMEEAEQRAACFGIDGRATRRPGAPRVTFRWFDLDHIGARLGEQMRAVRARNADGEVEHSQMREPGQSFRHVRKKSSSRGVQCSLTDGNIVQPCGASGYRSISARFPESSQRAAMNMVSSTR